MPCNSDYMQPTWAEIESSKVLALLKEIETGKLDPNFGRGYGAGYGNTDKATLDNLVLMLCNAIQKVDVTRYSLEMQMWWRDHKKADAERIEREQRIYTSETLRKAALRKLTPEERKALGVKDDE